MRRNHNTIRRASVTHFALGQTFITPGAEEALLIAGQTPIEFLRRHMSCDFGELSEEDKRQNRIALLTGDRVLSAYLTSKGQELYVTWNKGSDRLFSRLSFWFSIYLSSSKGCGNCGKLDVLCRVFQALWERWKNGSLFFHGFHSAAVSIARSLALPFYSPAHALPISF
jgi:hypothetical protein